MPGKIISIGTALPEFAFKQQEILDFMEKAYNNSDDFRKLKVLFHQSGIQKRHSVLPDFGMNQASTFFKHQQKQPNVDKRMDMYKDKGLELAIKSIHNTLKPVNAAIEEITHLITVTCTGLYAPGLGAQLIKHLSLKEDIPHTSVNFMGCNAAFYALKIADLIMGQNSNAKVLVVCVELCTLHFQPKNNVDNILSNTLFSDGAASVLISSETSALPGLTMNGFYSLLLHKGWDLMGWNVNPVSFEMVLNTQIPSFLEEEIESVIEKAFLHYKISKNDIIHWAIHPGGKKIVDSIGRKLNLSEMETKNSYNILNNYGNMSSPTILFILKKILDKTDAKNEKIFTIGFGPGLSIETALLTYA